MNYQLQALVSQLAIQYLDNNVATLLQNEAEINQDKLFGVLLQYSFFFTIDTAYGVWLDYVGYRIGVLSRPVTEGGGEPLFIPFGFDSLSWGNFDNAPFGDDWKSTDGGGLDDESFRRFLKVIARKRLTNGTVEDLADALELFFNGAQDSVVVQDNQNMTITVDIVTTISVVILNAVFSAGIVYTPAGVGYTARVNPTSIGFVFDNSTFDTIPFADTLIFT